MLNPMWYMCIIVEMCSFGSKYTCGIGVITMVANIIIRLSHTWTCDQNYFDWFLLLYVVVDEMLYVVRCC